MAWFFAKNAFEESYWLSEKHGWKDGTAKKIVLHAAVTGISAQLVGNPNEFGALACAVNKAVIRRIIGATINKLINKPGNAMVLVL